MKINEGRTPEQAEKYFNEGRTMYRNRIDPVMSEVYAKALEWKQSNIKKDDWSKYPIVDISIALIHGTL